MKPMVPLIAMRAFVEVGRTGSVKAAAESLGVTAGAVSQQIRSLEDRLCVTLFERRNRRVVLTDIGENFYATISESFTTIEAAADRFMKKRRPETLTVSTCGGFATSWLLPRLDRFRMQNPQIKLRVESTSRYVDLTSEPVDIAIRPSASHDDTLSSEQFRPIRLLPVVHPHLSENLPAKDPRRLLEQTLLHDQFRANWPLWFQRAGLVDARSAIGPSFDDPSLAVLAALRKQGIALVHDIFVLEELANGTLVTATGVDPAGLPGGYYSVCLQRSSRSAKIRLFRDWLTAEARREMHHVTDMA